MNVTKSDSTGFEIHPKVWGEEHWIVNRTFCGKRLVIKKGYQCSLHFHKSKDETFFVLFGLVLMEIEGELVLLRPGDKQDVLPGTKHRFTGMADSEIIEFSTHHEEDDSYRLAPSRQIPEGEFQDILRKFNVE